jgi:ribonuclease Z
MKLYLIGSGTPAPTKESFGTCYVVQVGEDHLMFDCGPSTTHKLVKAGMSPQQIDQLFITHHHYDHNAGLPSFLLWRWLQTRGQGSFSIWGPPRTEWVIDRLIGLEGAFSDDWKTRVREFEVTGRGPLPPPADALNVRDIEPGKVIDGEGWSVSAARAEHQEPMLHSLAYRVDSDEGSIAFSGDTRPCESVSQLARGSDTLVVTCWNHQETMARGPATSILGGTLDAANLAHEAGVKRLILSHTYFPLTRPGSKEKAIVDIGRVFHGEIIFGEELMVLEL